MNEINIEDQLITLIPNESGGFIDKEQDYSGIVSDMGIREYGEDFKKMCFIEFEDGNLITFFLKDFYGEPFINAEGKIKQVSKGIGQFVLSAKKQGFDTQIHINEHIFGCVPSIIGAKTDWKSKNFVHKDGDTGEVREKRDLVLKTIHTTNTAPQTPTNAPEPPKTNDVSPDDLELIQNLCLDILTEPMQKAGIWMAIPKAVKTANPNLSKALGLGLVMLVEEGFLSCVENKFELVG